MFIGTFEAFVLEGSITRWGDGMRYCRSDWSGLCLFCCYQPLCIISQQSWFGVFCFINLLPVTDYCSHQQGLCPGQGCYPPSWRPSQLRISRGGYFTPLLRLSEGMYSFLYHQGIWCVRPWLLRCRMHCSRQVPPEWAGPLTTVFLRFLTLSVPLMLAVNSSLLEVYLDDNNLTLHGIRSLRTALQRNHTLRYETSQPFALKIGLYHPTRIHHPVSLSHPHTLPGFIIPPAYTTRFHYREAMWYLRWSFDLSLWYR